MLLCLKTLSSPAAVQTACRPDRLFSWPADRQSLPVAPPTSPFYCPHLHPVHSRDLQTTRPLGTLLFFLALQGQG